MKASELRPGDLITVPQETDIRGNLPRSRQMGIDLIKQPTDSILELWSEDACAIVSTSQNIELISRGN